MPRLFPSLGRSSKENAHIEYGHHETYDPRYAEDYGHGYDERVYEPEPRNAPAWRRVLSKKPRQNERVYYGEEEGLLRNHSYRATVEDYPDNFPEHQPRPISSDSESFVQIPGPARSESPIPLVQRESSLTRLQEAFADHGTFAAATSEATTPVRGTPRYSPRQMAMAGPMEMANVHEARHEPTFVDNSHRARGHFDGRHASGYRPERTPYPTNVYPTSHNPTMIWEDAPPAEDYPPVVVVVEHGRHGKKDTYYIIPGGAPVVFEDEDGNELTRVGDFSGRYKPPRRPPPVIIQDQYGHEICRAGFPEGHSFNRSADVLYEDNRSGRRFDRERRGHDGYIDERDDRSGRSRSPPNVVYIDPSRHHKSRHGSSGSGSTGRSSPRHQDDRYRHEDRHDSGYRTEHGDRYRREAYAPPRAYDQTSSTSSVIHLDDFRPQRRQRSHGSSGSNGSSGANSYDGRPQARR